MIAFDRLVDALHGYGSRVVITAPGRASAQCPAHEDRSPSLSVRDAGGRLLVHCFGGCETPEVLASVGLGLADLYDEPRDRSRGCRPTLRQKRPRPAAVEPGWSYVAEAPDVPEQVRRVWEAARRCDEDLIRLAFPDGGPLAERLIQTIRGYDYFRARAAAAGDETR